MKRLISAGILTVILVLIATVGINYVKNRVDIHLGTLNTAVEYAKSGDYTSAQKEMTILDNQFIKSKKNTVFVYPRQRGRGGRKRNKIRKNPRGGTKR